MVSIPLTDLPRRLQRIIDEAVRQYRAAPRDRDGWFVIVAPKDRRFAIIEYGANYDEGIAVWLLVDLGTGAFASFTDQSVTVASYGVVTTLAEPNRVPRKDPVRRWLGADPHGGPWLVDVRDRDQLERFCAVEIVRTDHPDLLPVPRPGDHADPHEWSPTELPYQVLFGASIIPVTSLGTGRGRIDEWPKERDTVQGRRRRRAEAAREAARQASMVTLILTKDNGDEVRLTEDDQEFAGPYPVTFVAARTDKEPGVRFALCSDHSEYTPPFYQAVATPEQRPIDGSGGTVMVVVWRLNNP